MPGTEFTLQACTFIYSRLEKESFMRTLCEMSGFILSSAGIFFGTYGICSGIAFDDARLLAIGIVVLIVSMFLYSYWLDFEDEDAE